MATTERTRMSHQESLALAAGMTLIHRALRPRSDAFRARHAQETCTAPAMSREERQAEAAQACEQERGQ
jgi:hypothetical protein